MLEDFQTLTGTVKDEFITFIPPIQSGQVFYVAQPPGSLKVKIFVP